jgi:LysM repeat protein
MDQDSMLERLKQKYQPVLTTMQQLQVRTHSVKLEGSRLLIRGVAPSADAKNKVWDQVQRIDAAATDLICDLSIHRQEQQARVQASATMTAGASVGSNQGQRHYTVQPGDTLSKISRDFYGDASQFTKIFDANRHVLRDPSTVSPGLDLVIPE